MRERRDNKNVRQKLRENKLGGEQGHNSVGVEKEVCGLRS